MGQQLPLHAFKKSVFRVAFDGPKSSAERIQRDTKFFSLLIQWCAGVDKQCRIDADIGYASCQITMASQEKFHGFEKVFPGFVDIAQHDQQGTGDTVTF